MTFVRRFPPFEQSKKLIFTNVICAFSAKRTDRAPSDIDDVTRLLNQVGMASFPLDFFLKNLIFGDISQNDFFKWKNVKCFCSPNKMHLSNWCESRLKVWSTRTLSATRWVNLNFFLNAN
jgi:hypothetical protein